MNNQLLRMTVVTLIAATVIINWTHAQAPTSTYIMMLVVVTGWICNWIGAREANRQTRATLKQLVEDKRSGQEVR